MNGRIPPALLALGVAVLLVAGVVVFAVVSGSATPRTARTCGPALEAGAYQCITFVSTSGNGPAAQQAWLEQGGLTFALTRSDGEDRISFSGGCNASEQPARVTTMRIVVGAGGTTGLKACPASQGAHDDWAAELLRGTVGAVEQPDATLVVTSGSRRIVFNEVIAPRP